MAIGAFFRSKPKTLPKAIQKFMAVKFNLSDIYLDDLRYLENTIFTDDRCLRKIRVTSRNLLQQSKLKINKYGDLDSHPNLVLYDGYFENENNILINDKRVVAYSFSQDKCRTYLDKTCNK